MTRSGGLSGQRIDMAVDVGRVHLENPLMTASGTAGHGTELSAYFDLADLGAVVVKSLRHEPWPGNPPPRLYETPAGMINAVGLQGPGIRHWIDEDLPALVAAGATVVASIWGTTVDDYALVAAELAGLDGIAAVEVNLSCPNHHARDDLFAHSAEQTAAALLAVAGCGHPLWAKLSPNTNDLVAIAEAAALAGASAVTLVNTVFAMAIDVETRRPRLGQGGGGLSGPAIRPVAVRAVHDTHAALPDLPIVGVGGIASGVDAVEFMLAGASAVQVGTATFADPRAPHRVASELEDWCRSHGVGHVSELTGGAHG